MWVVDLDCLGGWAVFQLSDERAAVYDEWSRWDTRERALAERDRRVRKGLRVRKGFRVQKDRRVQTDRRVQKDRHSAGPGELAPAARPAEAHRPSG